VQPPRGEQAAPDGHGADLLDDPAQDGPRRELASGPAREWHAGSDRNADVTSTVLTHDRPDRAGVIHGLDDDAGSVEPVYPRPRTARVGRIRAVRRRHIGVAPPLD
jgi:hypothetical protein